MTTHQTMRLLPAARRTMALAAILAVCVAAGSGHDARAGSSPTEQEVKAAFIYNLAKFVDFPSSAFANGESPIVIGVFDDDRFSDTVERLVKGKSANGRRLEVKRFSKVGQCDNCNVLFVSASQGDRVSDVLDELKNTSVLTIGETEGFARRGGIVGFVVENSKVGFEINVAAAKRHGLRISSKLLSLAKAVLG